MIDYAAAVLPRRHRVAGVRLRTCCIGHALLLHRLRNPLGDLNSTTLVTSGLGDLAEALYVCSRPWRRAASALDGKLAGIRISWMALRVTLQRRPRSLILSDWVDYITNAWSGPSLWTHETASTPTAPEAVASLIHHLRTVIHATHDDILDTPITRAVHDVILHLARQGTVDIVDSTDDDLIAAADRMRTSLTNHGH